MDFKRYYFAACCCCLLYTIKYTIYFNRNCTQWHKLKPLYICKFVIKINYIKMKRLGTKTKKNEEGKTTYTTKWNKENSTKSRLHKQLSLVVTFVSKKVTNSKMYTKPENYKFKLRHSSLKCQIECIFWKKRLVSMYARETTRRKKDPAKTDLWQRLLSN